MTYSTCYVSYIYSPSWRIIILSIEIGGKPILEIRGKDRTPLFT